MNLFSLPPADRRATARTTNFVEPCSFQQKKGSLGGRRVFIVSVSDGVSKRAAQVRVVGGDLSKVCISVEPCSFQQKKNYVSAGHGREWEDEVEEDPCK